MFPGNQTSADLSGCKIYKEAVEIAYGEVLADAIAQAQTEYKKIQNEIAHAYAEVNKAGSGLKYYTIVAGLADGTSGTDGGDTATIKGAYSYTVTVGTTSCVAYDANPDNINAWDTAFILAVDGNTHEYDNDIALYTYNKVLADTRAAINNINPENYSTKADTNGKTDVEKASEYITAALDVLNAIDSTVNDNTAWDAVFSQTTDELDNIANTTLGIKKGDYSTKSLIAAIEAVYKAAVGEAAATGVLADKLSALTLSSAEPTEAAKLAWAQNVVLTKMVGDVNTWKNANKEVLNNYLVNEQLKKAADQDTAGITAAKETIEDIDTIAAAATEVITYLVNDADSWKDLVKFGKKSSDGSSIYKGGDNANFDANAAWLNELETTDSSFASVAKGAKVVSYAANWAAPDITGKLTTAAGQYELKITVPAHNGTATVPATYTENNASSAKKEITAITDRVDQLEKDAELAKASIEISGDTYVNIEKKLAKAIDETYYGSTTASIGKNTANTEVLNRIEELLGYTIAPADGTWVAGKRTVKVNGKSYDTLQVWESKATDNTNYYVGSTLDEANKAIADAKAAIYAAKTVEEADAAFLAGYEAFDAVATKADLTKAQATAAFQAALTKAKADIVAYVSYVDASKSADKTLKNYPLDGTKTTLISALQATFTDEVYSVDDLNAALAEAKAFVDNMKTNEALAAEKKSLEDQIAALPATATVADKETVVALRKAVDDYNDYMDMFGLTAKKIVLDQKLKNAEDAIQKAEGKAIADALKAINADGKVTVDEADAVAAVRALEDAYEKDYANKTTGALTRSPSATDVEKAEKALWAAQIDEVEMMIAKLPADLSDKAAVKAAEEAFNALDKFQQEGVDAKWSDKLDDMVKMLNTYDKSSVENLKITAGSTAKKGSITVKWTVKGDASAVEAFEIWKSTKKSSGFKKAFTTKDGTKRSYKNTKGLKKGTRYYYKVRAIAYDAAGKKITSDWSNKAYRKAK